MKEIKFRGKTKNGRWLVGELLSLNSHKYIAPDNGDWFDFIEWVPENLFHAPDSEKYEVDIRTIGQFTGLHDSIGIEVYEGDIIRSFDSKGEPIIHYLLYDNEEARFVAVLKGSAKGDFRYGRCYQQWITECEKKVIGNIHDNPELLKQK